MNEVIFWAQRAFFLLLHHFAINFNLIY